MIRISLNSTASVTLTEKGKEWHREWHRRMLGAFFDEHYIPPPPSGMWEVELWLLMHVFGEKMTHGSAPAYFGMELAVEPVSRGAPRPSNPPPRGGYA